MNNEYSIEEYLHHRGIEFKESNGELIVKCLFNGCDADSRSNEAHLYFSKTNSQYHCKKCDASGNIQTLAKHFGDNLRQIFPHIQTNLLAQAPRASKPIKHVSKDDVLLCHEALPARIRSYLNNRGISDRVINENKIGWGSFYGCNWITIPIPARGSVSEYSMIKLRRDPELDEKDSGDKMKVFPSGGTSHQIYDWNTLSSERASIILCEGEFDALALLSKGIMAVTGTGGCTTFKEEWLNSFSHLKTVYVCYDNDEPGKKGAENTIRKLSSIEHLEIKKIDLPDMGEGKKDITDYLLWKNSDPSSLFEMAISVDRSVYSGEEKQELVDILRAIPKDVPSDQFSEALQPLLDALCLKDLLVAERFISSEVKRHFEFKTQADIKPIFAAYKRAKKMKLQQEEEKVKSKTATKILDRDINFPQVLDSISRIGITHPHVVELVVAAFVAGAMRISPPIWLILVGVPSSFKTELVGLIDLPGVYALDTLTENAFVSGFLPEDGSGPKDLLPALDGKCFVVKDLTTIFSLKDDVVKKLLGDLTSIYDGTFAKFMATRGDVRYHSKFSMIGCVTPSILAIHHNYANQLGPRFFFLRIPDLTPEEFKKGEEIAWQQANRQQLIQEAREITSTYVQQAVERALQQPPLEPESEEVRNQINLMADFIARGRGTLRAQDKEFEKEENGTSKTIEYVEISDVQFEQPWRLLNSLRSLARVLSFIHQTNTVGLAELNILKPLVMSSMPIHRAIAINALVEEKSRSAKSLGMAIGKSTKTARRILKELNVLGLVEEKEGFDLDSGERNAKMWSITSKYLPLLNGLST